MVRDHLFDDCDAVLHWHPSSETSAGDVSSQARIAVKFRFHGTSAHAAAAPEKGRSALDAVELTNHAAEQLREHTPDFTRIHHVITAGGEAPNVVPDFAEVFYYIRHSRADVVQTLYPRLVKCAEAGRWPPRRGSRPSTSAGSWRSSPILCSGGSSSRTSSG